MLDADRVFLRDFTSLTFKNRMVAVQALLHAGKNSVPHAVAYLRHENPALSEAEAIGTEARIQERARFQAIMFAKIFGEFVGAVEDCGALCSAIRNRAGEGILTRYLKSGVAEVADFYDHVRANSADHFGQLFSLPSLVEMQPKMKPETFAILTSQYTALPKGIAEMAGVYRSPPSAAMVQDLSALPADWRESVQIMIEAPGVGAASTKGAVPQVFNKIKHRFMLVESPEAYMELPTAKEYRVIAIKKDGEHVHALVEAVRHASMGAAEVAALILKLDEEGIDI